MHHCAQYSTFLPDKKRYPELFLVDLVASLNCLIQSLGFLLDWKVQNYGMIGEEEVLWLQV